MWHRRCPKNDKMRNKSESEKRKFKGRESKRQKGRNKKEKIRFQCT